MKDNFHTKRLDKPYGWGSPPAPLLPRSLRSRMHLKCIPDWVCLELGLEIGATMENLGTTIWATTTAIPPSVRAFIINAVKSSLPSIGSVVAVDDIWPLGLRIADIGWTRRTRNALGRAGLLNKRELLTSITFRELAAIAGMGIIGLLDFSSCLEFSIERYEELATEYPGGMNMAESSGIGGAFDSILSESWAGQVSRLDGRFADLLPLGVGSLRDRIEDLVVDVDLPGSHEVALQIVAAADAIRKRVTEVKNLSLEAALRAFLRTLLRDKSDLRVDAMLARLGWNGQKHLTLKQSAERLGVTRERVRQIQMKILTSIPGHEVLMPQLDAALGLLEARAPLDAETAANLLLDAGISEEPFDAEELLEAAKVLGKHTSLRCERISDERVIFADSDEQAVTLTIKKARKLAGRSGISNMGQVRESLEVTGHELSHDAIASILQSCDAFHSLDDEWYMFLDIPTGRERLQNTLNKILSVTSPQSLSSLRQGVRRSFRGRYLTSNRTTEFLVPPVSILQLYIDVSDAFELTDNGVASTRPLNYRDELGETELLLVDVIRSSPSGILDRASLAKACLERGMNENTFNVYITYSPVLEHLGVDLWKLRGVEISPAAVEAVRVANRLRPRERRVLGYEWTADGKLLLAFRVSGRAGDSAVFGCPSAVKRFLAGNEYQCSALPSGNPCGKIGVNDAGTIYGCKTFIQRYGLDSDDLILARFDINSNTVALEIGYEDAWDDSC